MTSDPTVLRSWRGSSPRGFWPVWVRFEGTGKEGKRTWKMSCAWPLQRRHHQLWKLTLYHPEKKERTLQPLMNFIPLLTFPFPPWSVTLLSPSPRKSERGLLVFGACYYTDQGLGTMWFLCDFSDAGQGVKEGRPELGLVVLLWSRQHYRRMGKFHLFMLKFVLYNQSTLSKLWKKILEFFLLRSK